MKIEIERHGDGYNLKKILDDFANVDSYVVDVYCDSFSSLIANLSIYLESKYISVNMDN